MTKRFLVLIVLLGWLAGCAPAAAAAFQTADLQGNPQIKPAAASAFQALQAGQALAVGDQAQSLDKVSFARFDYGNAFFVLGPNTRLTVEEIGGEADNPRLRLLLEQGDVLVVAKKPLGSGYFEVRTANGVAAIHGSTMIVSQNITSGVTSVACAQGSASLSGGGSSVSLQAGQSAIQAPGGAPAVNLMPGDQIWENNPELMQKLVDDYSQYMEIGIFPSRTPVAQETSTPRNTPTRTLTPRTTWTPFPTGQNTPTGGAELPYPTVRPTITLPANFSGLTAEEQAAEGTHTYAVVCHHWGDCVCDSANATPVVTLPIVFDTIQATLGTGGEAFSYAKVWPNLYRVSMNTQVAEIRFLPEGFEFYVTIDSAPCSLQTFTREDQ